MKEEGGMAFVSYQGVTLDFSIRSLVHLLRKPQITESNSGGSQKSANSVFSFYCLTVNSRDDLKVICFDCKPNSERHTVNIY